MKSRYVVLLNDVSLESLDSNIYVSDIAYRAAQLQRENTRIQGRDGMYSGKEYISGSTVVVSFAVRRYDTQGRQATVQEIIRWAINGGWLKTSDRPGQMMYVKCSGLPAVTSALRWTDTLSVEFTALDYPFWVEEVPVEVTLTKDQTKTLYVPGVYKACAEATITAGAALTSLTVACGDTQMALDGVSVPNGGVIKIQYIGEHHLLDIRYNNESLLAYRTPESDDDLIAQPGDNSVTFTPNAAATCQLSVKGVWL